MNDTHQVFGFGDEFVNTAPEVFSASANDFKLKQLTHLNEKFNKKIGDIRVLNWRSTDGLPVQGLLITPANYNAKRKYPLYVDVHGGPSDTQAIRYLGGCEEYGEGLIPTTCPANILSLGYIVLKVNYRGSSGYGEDFRVKNRGDLGGGDYQDIMSGVNYVTQTGIVDTHKIAIAGWSYGGYLSAWAVSQTNQFAKAIDGDGITDWISYSGTTDDVDFGLRYFGKNYWDESRLYWARSPIAYVKNIKTPLLILQGENDRRVPLSQGQELLTALTILHRPVTMLIAAGQSHVPWDPVPFSKEVDAIDAWLQ
jgi:dipeptidyl aminopeptidase/acylaminoacyl peptidase